ncbi:MAG: GlsB/YeaQ/YmgE family stress response membrane protein [Acidimicrobiales bacterium]
MIGFIVFGLVVGVVARLLVPGKQELSLAMTVLLGVIGSVVGGVVANALGTGEILELNFVGSVVAIIAAVALIVVGERVGAIRRRFLRER